MTYYLETFTKYGWRWAVLFIGSSFLIGTRPELMEELVSNPAYSILYLLLTQFIAWVWYHKSVIEETIIDIMPPERESIDEKTES